MRSGTTAGSLKPRTRNVTSTKQSSFGRHPSRCRNPQHCSDRRRIRPRPPRLRVSLSRSPVLGSRKSSPNAQGLVAGVTDAAGGTTSYVYDAFGNLLRVGDPAGNVTANSYDVRGRRIASSDPDLGSWSYAYNVLGQLTSQTDALAQATTLAYDLLGRVTGQVQGGVTTGWTWGTSAAAHEIGQLASTTTGSGYTRTHGYDAYGRPSSTTLTVDGTAYTATTAYTGDGRADTVTYPSGFVAKYLYTSTGYLAQVKDNATAAVLWTANARDAELHLTQATLGNGVVVDQAYDANTGLVQQIAAGPAQGVANFSYAFDTIGNLASRADTFQGTTEQFCYDALNRLTDSAFVSGGSTCTTGTGRKTVSYSAIGNILSKTGTGSYAYPASGGGAGSRPHAVSSVTGTVNGAVNPAYTYDLNGNMTAGAGRTVAYTAFNMAATITQGANSYAFSYDSEHQRIKQTAPGLTTLYLNAMGAMSEKLVGGSSTTWRDYLYTDGKLAAQRDRVVSTGTVTWSWFVTDHLGSAAVITSAAGTVTERLSYDAWGKRRNANGSDAVCGTITSTATRGYTGHEMLGGLCLVNMNARIYDPDLGRFMTADTHVTDPLNLQDWNAYTYVNNNPLSFTDPTGHELTVGSATVVISQDAQSRAWVADANPSCSGCGPTTSEIKDAIKGAIGIYSGMSVSPSGLKVTTVGGVVNVHLAAGKWMNTGGNNTAHPVQNSGGAQAAASIDSGHTSGGEKFTGRMERDALGHFSSNEGPRLGLSYKPIQLACAEDACVGEAIAGAWVIDAIAGTGMGLWIAKQLGLFSATKTRRQEEKIDLYRAVSNLEFAQIRATGAYRIIPGGVEGKYFSLSLKDAQYFLNEGALGATSIVRSSVSMRTFKQLEVMPLDQRMSVFVTPETLPLVNADARRFGGIQVIK